MKMMTPDGNELMSIQSIEVQGGNVMVSGVIMGAMPMVSVITPSELRAGLKLLTFRRIVLLIRALLLQ